MPLPTPPIFGLKSRFGIDVDAGLFNRFGVRPSFGLTSAATSSSTPSNDTHFAFTEFYIQTTGSNLNAGSTNSDTALATYTNSAVSGWNATTGVFEVASGNPSTDGVTTGMFASVYVTAGATVATFVGRITAVSSTTITVSLTAVSGTPPTTDTTGARTLKVGGAWAGPSGTVGFPFNFVAATMTDSSSRTPCVNMKGGTAYSITAAMTRTIDGPVVFNGYTSTVRDGGRALITGPTTGASFVPLTLSGRYNTIADIEFQNNGATGSASGFAISGTTNLAFGVSVHEMRGRGIDQTTLGILLECEGWGNNTSNTTYSGGIHLATAGSSAIRCITHNNRGGSNGGGITMDTSIYFIECISAFNSGDGYQSNADTNVTLDNCDFYNNGGNGMNFTGGSTTMLLSILNCNFLKNGGYGILFRGFGEVGELCGNRFGAGTMANTSGDASTTEPFSMTASNNSSYAADTSPWSDPDNGVFNISLTAATGTGYGTFTALNNGFGTTVSYPDIGAAERSHA